MIGGLYAQELVDELRRLMSDRPGWPSTLLTQSTIGMMEELAEAGAQVANGILTPASFENLRSHVKAQILEDPGMGLMRVRGPLLAQIPREAKEFVPSSFKYKAWTSVIPSFETSYIHHWKLEFGKPSYADVSGPEFAGGVAAHEAACFIAAHLLHLGLNNGYLSRWLNYRAEHDPSIYDVDRIFEDMEDLIKKGKGTARILVILARPAQDEIRSMQGWLDVKSVREWLADHRLPAPRTIHGGILFVSEQWDIDGALFNVAKAVHRLRQRTTLKTGRAPNFYGSAWIAGLKEPRHLPATSQLGKELTPGYELGDPRVEAVGSDDRLEVAVELLLAALSEVGPSAVGTLWASLEALLAAPGDPDKIEVVQRATDVALVAMIRASMQISLGTLFSRCPKGGLTQRILSIKPENRLEEFEAALRRGDYESLAHRSTRLTLYHTRKLFEPEMLKEKRDEISQVLRGLYRQRNLVLHGGITDSPLLESIRRSSTPLVTAVINRYARATQDRSMDPHIFAYDMFSRLEAYLADPVSIVSSFW